MENYYGNAVVNFTDKKTPYTCIIEHNHFVFGTQPKAVISHEYSKKWEISNEPLYLVNNAKDTAIYQQYQSCLRKRKMFLGGRLGEYRYCEMDTTIASALSLSEKLLGTRN